MTVCDGLTEMYIAMKQLYYSVQRMIIKDVGQITQYTHALTMANSSPEPLPDNNPVITCNY